MAWLRVGDRPLPEIIMARGMTPYGFTIFDIIATVISKPTHYSKCVLCYFGHVCTTDYIDVIMSPMASQITSITIVYSTAYFRRSSNKTSKLSVTGLCAGNSPVTGEFPAQRASNAENVSIWWRHHVSYLQQLFACRAGCDLSMKRVWSLAYRMIQRLCWII